VKKEDKENSRWAFDRPQHLGLKSRFSDSIAAINGTVKGQLMMNRLLCASAFGLFMLTMPTVSNASCISLGIENNVLANAGCELGTTGNDFLSSPLQVNQDAMFGFTDWTFAEKVLDAEEDIDIGLMLTGNTLSGSWSINNVWSSYSHVMLVFKSGGGNISPPLYVGYLLVNGDTTGSYVTPFVNSNSGGPADISHVSAYVRPMPEPSSIVLLGITLAIAGVFRRR
jgi:hypothetical protein